VRPAIYSSGYNQHPPRLCDTMTTRLVNEIIRCPWGDTADSLMREYHDTQWGKPCRDERTLLKCSRLKVYRQDCRGRLSCTIARTTVPIINSWQTAAVVPPKTELSDRISRDIKRLGFKFVSSTIVCSFLQAVGMVNDHIAACSIK